MDSLLQMSVADECWSIRASVSERRPLISVCQIDPKDSYSHGLSIDYLMAIFICNIYNEVSLAHLHMRSACMTHSNWHWLERTIIQ